MFMCSYPVKLNVLILNRNFYILPCYVFGSTIFILIQVLGGQWLSGRVLDSRQRGRGFEPHRQHCGVSLSKNISLATLCCVLEQEH